MLIPMQQDCFMVLEVTQTITLTIQIVTKKTTTCKQGNNNNNNNSGKAMSLEKQQNSNNNNKNNKNNNNNNGNNSNLENENKSRNNCSINQISVRQLREFMENCELSEMPTSLDALERAVIVPRDERENCWKMNKAAAIERQLLEREYLKLCVDVMIRSNKFIQIIGIIQNIMLLMIIDEKN